MAQHDYDLANGTGVAFRSDANAALAAIVTNNSGASEPSAKFAYMFWADTTTGLLKQRNAANTAWITIGTLASTNLGLVPANGGTQTNVLGSAAAPSYSFTGDTNCGVFSPGADIVGITTGGTERARVTAQGYLKASNNGVYAGSTGSYHEACSNDGSNPVLTVRSTSTSYVNAALIVQAGRNTTNGTFSAFRYDNTAAGESRFSITDSGLVISLGSYNATTANAANLNIDAGGNIQRSTSSGDYKTDVRPVTEQEVDVVLQLEPIRYRSLAELDNSGWSYYGLIAESVAAVDPRLVHWGYRDEDYEIITTEEQRYNDETEEIEVVEVPRKQLKEGAQLRPEGVQYERVGVLTLALVQRQEQRIAALEAKLEELLGAG